VYSKTNASEPIRQGDIFRWLPKIDVVLGDALLPILVESEEKGGKEIDWFQFAQSVPPAVVPPEMEVKTAAVSVRSVFGIVISQDCDAARCEYVVFAEVKPFKELKGFQGLKEPPDAGKVIDIVTEHTRKHQKWYFLSDDEDIGFTRKMVADFDLIFEVKREMLVKYIEPLRIGRLDDEVAWPHFRERVAEFFRRYPYNEWYPLNSDEARAYEDRQKSRDPNFILDPLYRWQRR
jgi:hypothetical protein